MNIIGALVGLIITSLFATVALTDVPIEGYWKSIDDETNEATAYWKIEIKNDQLLGYIVNYPNAKVDDVCAKGKDRTNQPTGARAGCQSCQKKGPGQGV